MRRLRRIVERIATLVSGALMAAIMLILVYNVFARFLGGGISWYMESAQYLNVLAMLLVGVGITATGSHLRISALEEALKGRWKTASRVVVSLATIAFYLLFAYGGYLLATKSRQAISTMPSLKMAYVYWMLPVCGVLSALSTGLDLAVRLKGEDAPREHEDGKEAHG